MSDAALKRLVGALVVAPRLLHLHVKIEEHPGVEEGFQLLARLGIAGGQDPHLAGLMPVGLRDQVLVGRWRDL